MGSFPGQHVQIRPLSTEDSAPLGIGPPGDSPEAWRGDHYHFASQVVRKSAPSTGQSLGGPQSHLGLPTGWTVQGASLASSRVSNQAFMVRSSGSRPPGTSRQENLRVLIYACAPLQCFGSDQASQKSLSIERILREALIPKRSGGFRDVHFLLNVSMTSFQNEQNRRSAMEKNEPFVPEGKDPYKRLPKRIGVPEIAPVHQPFDPGYDPVTLESHLDQSSHLMSILKISMVCWMVANEKVTRRRSPPPSAMACRPLRAVARLKSRWPKGNCSIHSDEGQP